MNTEASCTLLEQIRQNWSKLKKEGKLRSAIGRLITISHMNCTVDDVIDIEESIPEYLK